ncbi:TPA: hypothetical protein DIS61_00740 [Patescibacteria group bacterium]|nr:MAG: hypothetical protein A2699_00340 [Candidatus Gottesmanbacteria bacterium RIFCSPHIGHO2_01_FULL_43_15]OGG24903.1 MAG: hypothetical protein A3A59_00505 [Candidatus Gottesmanbacteria bacterium RIFCSPLOWO2_01_FULL_42_10]HCM37160.1 hypothetical protein [Patescibacteria group bacterium]
MNKRFLVIFSSILLLAFFLRMYALTQYPTGFHIDEVTLGWNAYSILKTGRDETGRFLPLYSRSFGLDRALGNFLLTAVSINFLGLSEFAVRFPFAFFGGLTLILWYVFIKKLIISTKIALISTLLLAISPWHIALSRTSSESTVSLFLILLGHIFFLSALSQKKFSHMILSWVSLTLSLFFYHSAVGFVALSVITLGSWSFLKATTQKERLWSGLTLLFIGVLTFVFFIFGKGGANRFDQVAFYRDSTVTYELDKMRFEEGSLQVLRARIFHNKLIVYTKVLIKNYFDYFSVDFLFVNGGKPPRYMPPAMGLLYLFELPLLLIGLYVLARKWNQAWVLLFLLLLVSPVVAALTSEYTPNLQRSFFMVPYLEVIVSLGLWQVLTVISKKKLWLFSSMLLLSLPIIYYLHQYYIHMPVHDPLYRNDGAKELVTTVMSLKSQFDKIIITRDPEPPYHYFFFFTKLSPFEFQEKYVPLIHQEKDWAFEDMTIFTQKECPTDIENAYPGNVLFVNSGQCLFDNKMKLLFTSVGTITRKDGSIVYQLLKRKI